MKLIILDRDGTINMDRDDFVKSPDEWQPLPGALEAIARLNQAGWRVVVATNQSGLARGLFKATELNAMHAKMHKMLAAAGGKIDAVFFCPHQASDACACRKPEPGLFLEIIQRYGVNTKESIVHAVGDSARDAQAASAAHCQPHLVLTGKAEYLRGTLTGGQALIADAHGFAANTFVHEDLAAFAQHLLQP